MSKKDFDTEHEYHMQLFKDLLEIVKELGWTIAIPETDDDEEVPGIIIGTQKYVSRVTDAVDEAEDG